MGARLVPSLAPAPLRSVPLPLPRSALHPDRGAGADVAPTVGFAVEKFVVGRLKLTVVDLSGQEKYLKLWECYYAEAAAVIYVVDSADTARLSAAKAVIDVLMAHEGLAVRARKAREQLIPKRSGLGCCTLSSALPS